MVFSGSFDWTVVDELLGNKAAERISSLFQIDDAYPDISFPYSHKRLENDQIQFKLDKSCHKEQKVDR